MNNAREMEDGITASTTFIPRRPLTAADGSRQSRGPRPHSIGALIISNPKLVKGWQYYDNSPNPKSMQKYFSTINLPPTLSSEEEEIGLRSGGDELRGVGETGNNDDNHDIGVEIKACVAEDDEKKCCGHLIGIILTLLASTAFALCTVLVMSLTASDNVNDCYSPFSVSVWIFFGIVVHSTVILLCTCLISKERIFQSPLGNNQKSSMSRKVLTLCLALTLGCSSWLGVTLKIYSFKNYIIVPVPTVIAVNVIFLVFVSVFPCSKLRVIRTLTVGVILAGTVMICTNPILSAQEKFGNKHYTGTSMAAGSMVFSVMTIIILRYFRHLHYSLLNFIIGLTGFVGGFILCIFKDLPFTPRSSYHWQLAGSISFLAFIAQSLMTKALKHEEAGIYALVSTSEILLIFLFQFLMPEGKLPHLEMDLLSVIGAALVLLGIIITVLGKVIRTTPQSRKTRRWLQILV